MKCDVNRILEILRQIRTYKDLENNKLFTASVLSLSFWTPEKYKRSLLSSNTSANINIHYTAITNHKTSTKHTIKSKMFQFLVETRIFSLIKSMKILVPRWMMAGLWSCKQPAVLLIHDLFQIMASLSMLVHLHDPFVSW